MDPIDQAIAAASQPQPMALTLASTGRQVLLPPNVTLEEVSDIATWAQNQVNTALIGTVARMQQQLPKPTVLDTPRGPVAVVRKD